MKILRDLLTEENIVKRKSRKGEHFAFDVPGKWVIKVEIKYHIENKVSYMMNIYVTHVNHECSPAIGHLVWSANFICHKCLN